MRHESQWLRLVEDAIAHQRVQRLLGHNIHAAPEQVLRVHQQRPQHEARGVGSGFDEQIDTLDASASSRAIEPNTLIERTPWRRASARSASRWDSISGCMFATS